MVALLAEGVDRNTDEGYLVDHPIVVALLAEGVDRNVIDGGDERAGRHGVALLAEGVDRNRFLPRLMQKPWRRPPRGGRG